MVKIHWISHTTTLRQLLNFDGPYLKCSNQLKNVADSCGNDENSKNYIYLQAILEGMQNKFIAGDLATIDYDGRAVVLIFDPSILQKSDIHVLHGTSKWNYGKFDPKKSINFDNKFNVQFPLLINKENANNQLENEIVLSCNKPVSLKKYLSMIWTDISEERYSDSKFNKILTTIGIGRKIPIIRQIHGIDLKKPAQIKKRKRP
jgi:hypothetical protein